MLMARLACPVIAAVGKSSERLGQIAVHTSAPVVRGFEKLLDDNL